MDQDKLAVMMQMVRMGMTPDPLLRLQGQVSGTIASQQDRPPAFDLRLGPEELEGRFRQYKDWLERDRKLGPTRALRQNPVALLIQQNAARRRWAEEQADGRRQLLTTIVGFERHSSTTSLENLQRISLERMLVRKVHYGNYLLCRSISLPVRTVSAHIIVQDPDGDAVGLAIYNYPTAFECSHEYLDTLFPLGTILAIREPTFKPATQGPFPIIRVDTPTDIVRVASKDRVLDGVKWKYGAQTPISPSLPTTAEAWKFQGNFLFKTGKWLPAAIAYSHGLKLSPGNIPLLLNRSEAYLRLDYFSGALHDARCVLLSPAVDLNQRLKALYRAGRAEYGRGNFGQAEEIFNSCHASKLEDRNLVDWSVRSKRHFEETRGKYHWLDVIRMSQNNLHPEIGEYYGPIEVQPQRDRGGGRGIVASKNVAVGELLLVCKPFVSVFPGELPGNDIMLTIDLLSKKINKRSQSAIRSYVAQKIYGNPDLHNSVFDLYAGPSFPMPPPSYSPEPSEDAMCVDALSSGIDIDISRLDAICTYNCFAPRPLHRIGTSIEPSSEEKQACALYLLPSLFNHSCTGNALWITIGDVMVVRATQNISSGEEITFPYIGGLTHAERAKKLQHHLPSGCDCWLCREDLKDGKAALQRRHDIMSELSPSRLRALSVPELHAVRRALDATYATSRGAMRPEMAQIHHAEAVKLRGRDSRKQAMEADVRALASMGFVVLEDPGKVTATDQTGTEDGDLPIATLSVPTPHLTEPLYIMIALSQDYYAMQQKENAVRWLRAAQWLTSMVVGDSKEVFLFLVGPLLRRTGFFDFAQEVLVDIT